MMPDQNLPAVNTNQDIEQVCNNLPPKELNDFLLEQLFYTRKQLYYLDGNLYVRNGYHIEPVPDGKLESLVLSVLDDKFRLIGKRSRVKSVADLIRLRNPKDFINIPPDNKIIAFKNGVFDAEAFWFYGDSNPLDLYSDETKICSRYELNMEMNPEWFGQKFRFEFRSYERISYKQQIMRINSTDTFPFPDFCNIYNANIALVTPVKNNDGSEMFYYNTSVSFLISVYNTILNLHTPVADKFFSDIANGDLNIVERIYQMIGYILVPGNDAKAYFLLQGESNSGKSILGKFLEGYFPPELVTSLDISRLGGQYLPDALSTSCLNLSMDLPNGKMSDKSVAVLKMLTGDDIITHEVKYKDAKPYRNKCKFVFSTNFPLDMQIYDQAFLNRTVCIPFTKSVPYKKQDSKLLDKLNAERPYITAKALALYYVLRENNFTFSGNDHLKPKVTYRMDPNDIIKLFFTMHCETTDIDNDFVSANDLYTEYLAFCRENSMQALNSMPGFSQRLMYLYAPAIESDRKGSLNGYRRLKLYKDPVVFVGLKSAASEKTGQE